MSSYLHVFTTNVRRVLAERNLSLQDLAQLSGVSTSFLYDIMSGKGNPSLLRLSMIADALDLPLPYLFQHHNKNKTNEDQD